MDYLYDGTFEGFLTCVHMHYYREKATCICRQDFYQSSLLSNSTTVKTDFEKAQTVYSAIEEKISPYDLGRIYKVFKTDYENKEMLLLNYIRFGFKKGAKTSLFHGNIFVSPVENIERKVNNEIHRFHGLIRFAVLQGEVLYAVFEPDHDIVEFLAKHFVDRYRNDPFIIHDKKRGKALIAAKGEWYISDFTEADIPGISIEEKDYQRLWKKYFESIAIKERTNAKCQRNFMPVRYWDHLPEIGL